MMKKIEIESWALRILGRVKNKVPIEDSFVELKAEWPDTIKAARRIAGHSNAAHGENVLWLIGVDEEKGIVGANQEELSNWLPKVQSHFDGVTPMLDAAINVIYDDKTICALCFDTSRAPFVVQNPAFGKTAGEPVKWEVPWRDGTLTRSATRNDIINLLTPQVRVPAVEILEASLQFGNEPKPHIEFSLMVYLIPKTQTQLIFPIHKCEALISYGDKQLIASEVVYNTPSRSQKLNFDNEQRISAILHKSPIISWDVTPSLIDVTTDELIVRGAGKILVIGKFNIVAIEGWSVGVELKVNLVEANSEIKIPLALNMVKDAQGGSMVWDGQYS